MGRVQYSRIGNSPGVGKKVVWAVVALAAPRCANEILWDGQGGRTRRLTAF